MNLRLKWTIVMMIINLLALTVIDWVLGAGIRWKYNILVVLMYGAMFWFLASWLDKKEGVPDGE